MSGSQGLLYEFVELVVRTDFFVGDEGDELAFGGCLYGVEVETDFVDCLDEGSCGVACDEYLVAYAEVFVLDEEFSDSEPGEVLGALAYVHLLLGGLVAVDFAPLTQSGSLVIAVPEPTVEDGGEFCVPAFDG